MFDVILNIFQGILASIGVDGHVVSGALIGAMAYIATTPPQGSTRFRRLLLFVASWWMGVYTSTPAHHLLNAVIPNSIAVELPYSKPAVAFIIAAMGIWLIESIKSGNIGFNPIAIFGGKNGKHTKHGDDND